MSDGEFEFDFPERDARPEQHAYRVELKQLRDSLDDLFFEHAQTIDQKPTDTKQRLTFRVVNRFGQESTLYLCRQKPLIAFEEKGDPGFRGTIQVGCAGDNWNFIMGYDDESEPVLTQGAGTKVDQGSGRMKIISATDEALTIEMMQNLHGIVDGIVNLGNPASTT